MNIKNIFLRNYLHEKKISTKRIIILSVYVILGTILLIIYLYYLQIYCYNYYNINADKNRIKFIPLIPNRGIIYDCNGIPLVINKVIYQLELIPDKVKNISNTLLELSKIITLTDDEINLFNKKHSISYKFSSIPIKIGLNEVQKAIFSINKYRFPGVKVVGKQLRYYPYRNTLTHVVGYISKINNTDIKWLYKNNCLQNYVGTEYIGKTGIERYYESTLHGITGYKKIEVNKYGNIIRNIDKKYPISGKDITLTIDLHLQQYIEKLLGNDRAAVIVLDPRNGDIKALISTPSFDPNLFVNGMSMTEYHSLLNNKNFPLINRTIQGIYPPASTVKPYIAISALYSGIITKNFVIKDPGWWKLPGTNKYFRDWKSSGHGLVNIIKALEESSDTFFYHISYMIGIDKLSKYMKKFGYGQHSGIDLIEENLGNMPTKQWKLNKFHKPWYPGDTISVGIGQGYWTATPIQMAKSLMILINNGLIRIPHLLHYVIKNNFIGKQNKYIQFNKNIQLDKDFSDYWNIIKDGMYGVANRSNGTVRNNFLNTPYEVAAKSGTAQLFNLKKNKIYNKNKISKYLHDHKLMIAYAPFKNPKIGVVVVLENGGSNVTVGQITRKIFDYILLKKN